MFHHGEPLTETVWEKLMLGLSTRKYGQAIRQFSEAYGLEKSAVSEHFIEASRAKLKDMMELRLEGTRLCALLIDATPFEGRQMVAALGIGQDGRKTILGLRQGATENATVVSELLNDLVNRGSISRNRVSPSCQLLRYRGWGPGTSLTGTEASSRKAIAVVVGTIESNAEADNLTIGR